ncbi:MAG: hypothetical protein WBA44_10435 [Mesorhizobium sp.]
MPRANVAAHVYREEFMQEAKSDDIRVADYVLGLMDAREHERFERDMDRRPELARLVAAWRERVAEADASVQLTPQERMRRRIEAGLMRRAASGNVERRHMVTSDFRNRLTSSAIGFVVGVLVGAALVWFALG